VASREQALQLARQLIDARLAACVQLQAIESVYRWDGSVQQAPEWRLLIKSSAAAWPRLQAFLQAQHPYELPALLALRPSDVEPGFAAWVAGELAP